MPRYLYRCTECNESSTIFHLSDETAEECPKCGVSHGLVKSMTRFNTRPKQQRVAKIGDTTEESIQEASRDLHQYKKDLNKKR